MHKHGGDIYTYKDMVDFSANINPQGTPQSIIDAAYNGIKNAAQYPDVEHRELKAALEVHEEISASHLICGNGAADLIFSLVLAKKPKKALLIAPTFYEYEQALRSVDCEIQYYCLKKEMGFTIQEDYLDSLYSNLDMIFLCNPNNPTGLTISKEFLNRVLAKCQEHDILFVLDECFNNFLDEPDAFTMKEALKNSKHLFILKAFTKMYAMAGLRLGYGFSTDKSLLEKMNEVSQPWSVSTPAQYGGIAALKEKEYVKRTKEIIYKERNYLIKELLSLGLTVYPSKANYIFFQGPKELHLKTREIGYMIRDCSNYYGLEEGYYRIAVKNQEENQGLIKAMNTILEVKK